MLFLKRNSCPPTTRMVWFDSNEKNNIFIFEAAHVIITRKPLLLSKTFLADKQVLGEFQLCKYTDAWHWLDKHQMSFPDRFAGGPSWLGFVPPHAAVRLLKSQWRDLLLHIDNSIDLNGDGILFTELSRSSHQTGKTSSQFPWDLYSRIWLSTIEHIHQLFLPKPPESSQPLSTGYSWWLVIHLHMINNQIWISTKLGCMMQALFMSYYIPCARLLALDLSGKMKTKHKLNGRATRFQKFTFKLNCLTLLAGENLLSETKRNSEP